MENSPEKAPQKRSVTTLLAGGLLLIALALYWCFFTVSAGSVVVVKSLGAISRVLREPGLYGKAPWPIHAVVAVDVRTRVLTVQGSEVLTKDKFNVIPTVALGWRIREDQKSVRGFFKTLHGSVVDAEAKLVSRVNGVRKQLINSVRLQDIITTNPGQKERFTALEKRMLERVQKGLDEAGYGIGVELLLVQSIKFPADVTEKVFARMIKERERVSLQYIAEGQGRAKQIRDDAMSDRAKTLADAEAKAIRLRGSADAEVAEVYKVFEKHAELAIWLRKAATLRKVLGKRSTIILPAKDPLGGLLEPAPKGTNQESSK